MDVVLRTSHDEAEISLGVIQPDVELGAIVEQVTGRPSPRILFVDGRALPAGTGVGGCGLLVGSVISTSDETVAVTPDAVLELVQVAGMGGGATTWLSPGRYNVGPGRRVSAAELDLAPVADPLFELTVGADAGTTVRAIASPVRLEGREVPADRAIPWAGGLIDVGARVFEIRPREPGSAPLTGHRFSGVSVDGTAAFNRPPREAASPDPTPLDVPTAGGEVRRARRIAPNWWSGRHAKPTEPGTAAAVDSTAMVAFTDAAADRRQNDVVRQRAAHPNLADAVTLARSADPTLWQRRADHHDAYQFAIGLADIDWDPTSSRSTQSVTSGDSIVTGFGLIPMVPIVVDLLNNRGLGVVGAPDFSLGLARGLLIEAAVTHGPADLDIVILTSRDRMTEWEWAKWLPHARTGGAPRVLYDDDQINGWAAAVRRGWERPSRPTRPSHLTLVVVDEPGWWRDRSAPLRALFAEPSLPLRFVALTTAAEDVPAVCTTVVTARHHQVGVDYLIERRHVADLRPFVASISIALAAARRLAPLDDPDLPMSNESVLPDHVPILKLFDIDEPDAPSMIARWSSPRLAGTASTPIGLTERGPMEVDLVHDGPHALIAGTTGSGMSELLRSLVVGLATNLPPDEINFVLVDFKGGSVFDACADLPHTVASVTDLDEHLASRLLRCLRAEVQYRELTLRAAGVSALSEYRELADAPALPRLVLVVDEFASVATELPDFLPSLIDIANRGRSLGLHMVLATQRPAGVVDNKIKANTNLRIALRLQDDGDSLDVIATKDAALLPRRLPGRAYARLGAGELTLFQSAYSSGASAVDDDGEIEITPFVVRRQLSPLEHRLIRRDAAREGVDTDVASDLVRLVAAANDAALELGQGNQRRPYPDPLPRHLPISDLLAAHPGDGVPFAMVDFPDEQRQEPRWWTPGEHGSVIAYGIAGSGTSSMLITLALGVAQRYSADDVHLYCIDADTNLLTQLDGLAHCGAVVRIDEAERVARLARHLLGELERRQLMASGAGGSHRVAASEPAVVLMIDNVGALRQMLDDRRDLDGTWSALEQVIRDGRPLGICAVLTAKQEKAIPSALTSGIPDRLVLRLGDHFAYAGFGFRSVDLPDFVPGRALHTEDKVEIQLAEPPRDLAEAISDLDLEPARDRPAHRIDPLPSSITIREIADAAAVTDRGVVVPVGLDTRSAERALAVVPFGETFMITGAPGTGRSSILMAFASAATAVDPPLRVFSVTPRGGPVADLSDVDRPRSPDEVADWVERVAAAAGRRMVLIDDADRLGGTSFERLAAIRDDDLITVVAGRADDLRSEAHWSRPLQRHRNGVLLRPSLSDGEVVKTSLGTRLARFGPHMGILVNDGELIPLLAAVTSHSARETVDGEEAEEW